MPARQTVFRARHVATMTATGVIEDGCVIVEDGVIQSVGRTADVRPSHIDVDLDGLLTPGLVNAHTHLELTNVPRPPVPGTFQDWLLTTMAATYDPDSEAFAKKRADAVRAGIDQCLRFGVTTVGDVTQHASIVRPVLAASPLRGISYGECLGLGPRQERFVRLLKAATNVDYSTDRLRVGVSPHSPYTVDPPDYATAMVDSLVSGGHVTTHLAESPDEAAFVQFRTGPFAAMYRRLGFDPGPGSGSAKYGGLFPADCDTFEDDMLLVHVNYVDARCLTSGYLSGYRIVWCPRTHAYFGHPSHPWRQLVAAGAIVCIGTDSAASSGDLNLMDDLRLVRRQNPDVSAAALWALITTAAATAMRSGYGDDALPSATLSAGEPADLIAWPTRSSDPLAEVLDTPRMLPSGVWIGGLVSAPSTPREG